MKASWPPDIEPGLKLAANAIEKMQSERDALPALLPIGLGQRSAEFDKVFRDAFQLIVLRGQKPHAVLDLEAARLNRLMIETGAAVLATRSSQYRRVPGAVAGGYCRQSIGVFLTRPPRPTRRRGFRLSSLWRSPKRCP